MLKLMLCVVPIVLLVVGCGDDSGDSGSSAASGSNEEIVIGAPIALTSDLTAFDLPLLEGAKIAADEVNAKGGLLGGRKIRFVTSDTGGNPAQGQTAALEVIDKGADFIMPSLDYDKGSPAARTAESKGIVAISAAGDPRYGLQGIGRHFFNVYSGSTTEGAVAAQFAKDEGWTRMYMLEDTISNYSKVLCKYFEESFKALGGTVVGKDTFVNTDKSISTQVSRLRDTPDVDAVMLCSFPPGGATALKQLRGGGVDLPVLGGTGFDGNFWIAAVPGEGNFYTLAGGVVDGKDPDPERARVIEAYAERTGKPTPAAISPMAGYSAMQALFKAIEKAGATDADKVIAALESFRDEPLAAGPTTWTKDCHVALGRPLVVTQIKDGKQVYVGEPKPTYVPKSVC